jgi:hypothetical protein
MESFEIVDVPAFRLIFFLAITGVFFYRSYPKPEWKWYLGLPIYWLYVLFFYFGYAGMISAGLSDGFKGYLNPQVNIEDQLTITSIILLFVYRFFSRYLAADESTEWAAEFIKDILTTSLVLSGLFFAFLPYILHAPRLEAFSQSWTAYLTLGICVGTDFVLWFIKRRNALRAQADA